MYNHFIEPLLYADPQKCISSAGIAIRRRINPIIRFALPFTTKTKLHVVRRAKIPSNRPVIYAAAHGFKEDIEHAVLTVNTSAYILVGSLGQIFHSFDGIAAWANGLILVNRMDKQSRKDVKQKMIRALDLGANIIIYPEGTWNKSPNQLMSGLFPGVYDVAKATGALVAPVGIYLNGQDAYSILDEAFDITKYGRVEGVCILRDKLATLQFELMEMQPVIARKELPTGKAAEAYWKEHIDRLMAEVEYYAYEEELHTKFVDKSITEPTDAFAHLKQLIPCRENAFLLRER